MIAIVVNDSSVFSVFPEFVTEFQKRHPRKKVVLNKALLADANGALNLEQPITRDVKRQKASASDDRLARCGAVITCGVMHNAGAVVGSLFILLERLCRCRWDRRGAKATAKTARHPQVCRVLLSEQPPTY